MIKTIRDIQPTKDDLVNSVYMYQPELTTKLDAIDSDFDQAIINEIVLWKVNRYAAIDKSVLCLLNKINKEAAEIDKELTREILVQLLKQNGIRLAIASTILRFKNPKIYQIIDQRVYRFIYGQELFLSKSSDEQQVEIYMSYLLTLRKECYRYGVRFENADRIFYSMDKKYNSDYKLKW
jgi:hypothetical protein